MSRFLELFTLVISGKIEKRKEYKFGFVEVMSSAWTR